VLELKERLPSLVFQRKSIIVVGDGGDSLSKVSTASVIQIGEEEESKGRKGILTTAALSLSAASFLYPSGREKFWFAGMRSLGWVGQVGGERDEEDKGKIDKAEIRSTSGATAEMVRQRASRAETPIRRRRGVREVGRERPSS
jgi:hypothetical protein